MTPTNQTRLAEIRKKADSDYPRFFLDDVAFLLSLLSQETKRADEAEANVKRLRQEVQDTIRDYEKECRNAYRQGQSDEAAISEESERYNR